MHGIKTLFYTFLLFYSLTIPVVGQVSFEAKVSKNRLGVNEQLRVDFIMNKNGDNFIPPEFKGFRVVGGPSQSIQNSYVNGKISFSKTYTYFLSPRLKGNLTIYQAQVEIDGQVYKTSPVTVEVTEAVKKPKDENSPDYLIEQNLHLVIEVSKANPYLNEGISVVYKLYFRNPISVSDLRELESPAFKDFWVQNIKIPQLKITRGTYQGNPYNQVILRRMVLYPQKAQRLEIESLTLDITLEIPSSRRDFFGNRILQQLHRTATSGKRTINVKPLPESGKPKGFDGAVGQFDFDVLLDKDVLKASESLQARVKVKGTGNLKLFDLPKLSTPNTLEVYEPEHTEKVETRLGLGMQGSVEDVYTIVPQYQGNYPIPIIAFSYFDPKAKKYKTLYSQELLVNVFDGPIARSADSDSDQNATQKQFIESLEGTFRFIKLEGNLQPVKKKTFWMSTAFFILLLLPFILLIGVVLIRKYVFNRTVDETLARRIFAQRLAKKYLSSAKKAIGKQSDFYEALERALHNYLKAKLRIETFEFSKEKIRVLLLEKQIQEEDITDFISLLENCEEARYAPGSQVNMDQDLDTASSVIAIIDKQF